MVADAELIAIGIAQDEEVAVIGIGPVLDAASAQRDQSLDMTILPAGNIGLHSRRSGFPMA